MLVYSLLCYDRSIAESMQKRCCLLVAFAVDLDVDIDVNVAVDVGVDVAVDVDVEVDVDHGLCYYSLCCTMLDQSLNPYTSGEVYSPGGRLQSTV